MNQKHRLNICIRVRVFVSAILKAQDPTVFAYDEVYEDLKGTKDVEKKVEKVERKSRYIEILMKKAELRNQVRVLEIGVDPKRLSSIQDSPSSILY